MTGTEPSQPQSRRFPVLLVAGAALAAGAGAGAAVLYVGAGAAGNEGTLTAGTGAAGNEAASAACPANAARFAAIDAAARGDVAAMRALEAPVDLSDLRFRDAGGAAKTLSDYAGQTLLVNLWATWCAPCREEMPALDALEAKRGGPDFSVLPINVDDGAADGPLAFYEETGLAALPFLRDETMGVFNELRGAGLALGLPVTLIVDEAGCARGVMNGPADWAGADAARLIEAATGAGA